MLVKAATLKNFNGGQSKTEPPLAKIIEGEKTSVQFFNCIKASSYVC